MVTVMSGPFPLRSVRRLNLTGLTKTVQGQWRTQDFPGEEGDNNHKKGTGAPTYYLVKFVEKVHENEEKWTERFSASHLDPFRPFESNRVEQHNMCAVQADKSNKTAPQ